jgi:putative ABC transport system permease protein
VHSVDPQIALATPQTMGQVRDQVLANDRFTVILFASFAAVALLLAAIGIYGVMAFSVAQRSHEIALRMALGSSRNRMVGHVVKEGFMLACIGLMRAMLFGIGAIDLSAFGTVGIILLLAALACYLPARRAASANPMDALRGE